MKKFVNITELSEILKLNNNKKNSNHVLRYWEKQFKQIIPKKINNRRYYSPEQVETVKLIVLLVMYTPPPILSTS